MEKNIQNQNTTAQVAKKSFFGGLMGSMGVVAGINIVWIAGCGLLFLLIICCCSLSSFASTVPSTDTSNRHDVTPTVSISPSEAVSLTPTSTISPTATPTPITKIIDINQYLNKPMTQVSSLLGTTIKKASGNGDQFDRISVDKENYSIYIQSTSNKTNTSYIQVIIKNKIKCDRATYKGLENYDNNLIMVGLNPSIKGNVELYFGRSYAAWTKNYNKDYTVNSGCNSDGDIYLNYGLTKCQSLVNGKLPSGC